jgi:hypothetical protein
MKITLKEVTNHNTDRANIKASELTDDHQSLLVVATGEAKLQNGHQL